jgi:hypothetical protein
MESKHFWDHMGSQEQAAFLDAYTKLITGGQAIRGFTLRLNTEHASLWDKANVLLNQAKTGGPLSKRQILEMVQVARDYANNINDLYQDAEGRANTSMTSLGLPGDASPWGSGALGTELGQTAPMPDAETPPPPASGSGRFSGYSATPG